MQSISTFTHIKLIQIPFPKMCIKFTTMQSFLEGKIYTIVTLFHNIFKKSASASPTVLMNLLLHSH